MLLNNRNVVLGQDGQTNSGGDVIPNIGSPGQSGGSRNDIDILIKVSLQISTSKSLIFQSSYKIYFLCEVIISSLLKVISDTMPLA